MGIRGFGMSATKERNIDGSEGVKRRAVTARSLTTAPDFRAFQKLIPGSGVGGQLDLGVVLFFFLVS